MNHDFLSNFGIGATEVLSLRVSVAALVRVLFKHPEDGTTMLALERKATLHETEIKFEISVKAQPFGGAIRILDLKSVKNIVGDFHFDSERSRSEQDFRIFIQPESWLALRSFCIEHLSRPDNSVFETEPVRELAEEFFDTLKIHIRPKDWVIRPLATILEENPTPTDNIYASGHPTARIYRTFEAMISDPSLIKAMMDNNKSLSTQNLCDLAIVDAQNGGKGRANAVLVLPLKRLRQYYCALPLSKRHSPVIFMKNRLAETVPAVLDGVAIPKYQRLSPLPNSQ